MPFPEPETPVAATTISELGSIAASGGIRVLAARESGPTTFQRLARRLNDLREDSYSSCARRTAEGSCPQNTWRQGRSCYQGVTPFIPSGYNESVMLTVADAAQQIQFASS